jgi:hypothetical protein
VSALLQRIAAIAIVITSTASAHDRHGNAAMHQDVRVLIAKDHVEVTFQIETNEEGTFVEAIAMDANGDGKLSSEEQAGYFAHLDARLREGLQIEVDGKDIPLAASKAVELNPPARKTFRFRGPLPTNLPGAASLEVHNDNFLDWPGRSSIKADTDHGISVKMDYNSGNATAGFVTFMPGAIHFRTDLLENWGNGWSAWSWRSAVLSPRFVMVLTAAVLAVALMLGFREKFSRLDRMIGLALVATGLTAGILFLLARNPLSPHEPLGEETWAFEFRSFHRALMDGLCRHHQGMPSRHIVLPCSDASRSKLLEATRVVGKNDEKSGTFEFQRVQHLSTTVLRAPTSLLNPILRVHHEWRAVGLMRHQGHPHERIRGFSCDYTLRVTDRGLQLLDCSDWHQLPDEPVEE